MNNIIPIIPICPYCKKEFVKNPLINSYICKNHHPIDVCSYPSIDDNKVNRVWLYYHSYSLSITNNGNSNYTMNLYNHFDRVFHIVTDNPITPENFLSKLKTYLIFQ